MRNEILNTILISFFGITFIAISLLLYSKIEKRESEICDSISELKDRTNDTNSSMAVILSTLEEKTNDELIVEVQKVLAEIIVRLNDVYKETVSTRKSADNISTKIEKSSGLLGNDSAYMTFVEEGDRYFERKNYSASTKSYTKALQIYEDSQIRLKRTLSLYYQNPMEKKNYGDILYDCQLLRQKGFNDPRLDEIENNIRMEKGEIQ